MCWAESSFEGGVRLSCEAMELRCGVAAVVHSFMARGLERKAPHQGKVDAFTDSLRVSPQGPVVQEMISFLKELPDIQPEDLVLYASETFIWFRHLASESQQALAPQSMEAKRLKAECSAAKSAALLAEAEAELHEFDAELAAAAENIQRAEGAMSGHRARVAANTRTALASEDFNQHYRFVSCKKDEFPGKALEQWKRFKRDVLMWSDLEPTELAVAFIADFDSFHTFRPSLVKDFHTFLSGADPMVGILFPAMSARIVGRSRASTVVSGAAASETDTQAVGLSLESSEDSDEDDDDDDDLEPPATVPLPEDLSGRPVKIRRTEADEYLQFARDSMALEQQLCLASPDLWYPIRFTFRQGPTEVRGKEKFEIRPAHVLLPNVRLEGTPWYFSLPALEQREVLAPDYPVGVLTTKKAARAAAGPPGSAKIQSASTRRYQTRWQKGPAGSGVLLGDMRRAAQRVGAATWRGLIFGAHGLGRSNCPQPV